MERAGWILQHTPPLPTPAGYPQHLSELTLHGTSRQFPDQHPRLCCPPSVRRPANPLIQENFIDSSQEMRNRGPWTAPGSSTGSTCLQHHRWEMRFLQAATRLHFARKGLRTKEAVHRQWCDPFPMHLPEFRITTRSPEQPESRTPDNCSRAGCLFWPRHPLPHNRDGKMGHVRRDLGNC